MKVVTYSNEMPVIKTKNANGPMFARLAGGTTLLPIASSFPPVDSPLNLPCWVQSLTDHLNRTLVNELLCDITTVFTLASKVNDENTSQTIINQQILIPRPLPAKSH